MATGASGASGATGAIVNVDPFVVRYPYRQIFNNIQWTRLPDLQRILNKDVSTYRTTKEVMADLNRLRAYITPPPVRDAAGKDIIIDSIYSCRISPVSTARVQITAKETTLGNELIGFDTAGTSRTFRANQCSFVRTPLTGGQMKEESAQKGGQITFLPTATFRTQAPNLAVLMFNLENMKKAISPDTYQSYINENKKRKTAQEEIMKSIEKRAEDRVQQLIATETARLTKGLEAIDKVITQQQADQAKLTETYTAFDTSVETLKAIYEAAVAKSVELEGRFNELEAEQGGMFGGARKRKRTRKARRVSRKKTRKN